MPYKVTTRRVVVVFACKSLVVRDAALLLFTFLLRGVKTTISGPKGTVLHPTSWTHKQATLVQSLLHSDEWLRFLRKQQLHPTSSAHLFVVFKSIMYRKGSVGIIILIITISSLWLRNIVLTSTQRQIIFLLPS